VNQLPRVLVVDDDEAILEMVQDALEGAGYAVLTAADGADALLSFASQRPDVVLLDIMMPRLDGPATLHELRRIYSDKNVPPVIVMTAARHARERALELQTPLYLEKPFDMPTLLAHVEVALGLAAGVGYDA
jgi:DNA-binding response OmpR family regulator